MKYNILPLEGSIEIVPDGQVGYGTCLLMHTFLFYNYAIGVRATKDIKTDTGIGVYSGELLTGLEGMARTE